MDHVQMTFKLRNDLAALGEVSERIEQAISPWDIPPRDTFAIQLVLDELVSNTIKYGCADGAEHELRIELNSDSEAITITLEDDARPFNPLLAKKPVVPEELEDREIGGLGIHITRNVIDESHYTYENGRNRLVMKKKKSLGPVA